MYFGHEVKRFILTHSRLVSCTIYTNGDCKILDHDSTKGHSYSP